MRSDGTIRFFAVVLLGIVFITSACSRRIGSDQQPGPPVPSRVAGEEDKLRLPMQPDADRPLLTMAQCAEMGALIVGDPGDGRVHRPDYVCEGGVPPLGTIQFEARESISIEGSVCCPH